MDQYLSTLLALEPSSATSLVLLGVSLEFCSAHKDKATIEKHKVRSPEVFCHSVGRNSSDHAPNSPNFPMSIPRVPCWTSTSS